jgi:hypothetical protein
MKSARKRSKLVSQYLELIPASQMSAQREILEAYYRRTHGIYALYKGKKLYYCGLAVKLRRRLRQHLRDRHNGKWNTFSIYCTTDHSHMHDLESLVLRIARPPGNGQAGKFTAAKSLNKTFRRAVVAKSRLKR